MKKYFFWIVWSINCVVNAMPCDNSNLPPRLALAGDDPPALMCWYVENDGSGHHGYVGVDVRISAMLYGGNGLFSSIKELKKAIDHLKTKHPIIYAGAINNPPAGWKIRGLTEKEVKFLDK